MFKKIISLFMSAVILLCIVSCTVDEKYEIREIGGWMPRTFGNHYDLLEEDQKYQEYKEAQGKAHGEYDPASYTVIVGEKEYVLERRSHSEIDYRYKDHLNYYLYEEGNTYVKLLLNEHTGKIDMFNFYDSEYLKSRQESEILTQEACLDIAKELLLERTANIDVYTVEVEHSADYYNIKFLRYINGHATHEYAYFKITEYGDVIMYLYHMIGAMDDFKFPTEEECAIIKERVQERLDSSYGHEYENYEVKFEAIYTEPNFNVHTDDPDFQGITRMYDGRYAYNVVLRVTRTPKEGYTPSEHIESEDVIQLLIYLE